mmetsp:Transcript_38222/g.123694  ORF Transcript_38222/g.123694 Transcript_38222/m.123694 type:complete len:203 (-) Transcript_38222:150-758(-)
MARPLSLTRSGERRPSRQSFLSRNQMAGWRPRRAPTATARRRKGIRISWQARMAALSSSPCRSRFIATLNAAPRVVTTVSSLPSVGGGRTRLERMTTTASARPSCSSARGEGPLAVTELTIAALGSRTVGRRRRPPPRRRRAERAAGAGLLRSGGGGEGGAEEESAEGETASSERMEDSSSSSPTSGPGSSRRKVGSLSPGE